MRFESVLTGAGINRTAYRTVLHIEAVLFTAERDGADPVTVTAAYPVYEAVLAGDVPQYVLGGAGNSRYTYLKSAGGDIFAITGGEMDVKVNTE